MGKVYIVNQEYKANYKVFFVDSKKRIGFDDLVSIFKDKISVLSGQTGAGKSTFINSLIPGFNLQTQEISEALGRGKHTTTATELYEFEGGFIGDTPGFSKLDFSIMEASDIKEYFIECGLWYEDYYPLFNIVNIIEAHIKERFL